MLPPIELTVEQPFPPGKRPRPTGRVAAAGHDEELARWNLGGNGDANYVSNREGFHPGARVVVDVLSASGGLPKQPKRDRRTGRPIRGGATEHSLLAHARKWGYWSFRICFEAALRKDPTDHGQTRLRLVLAPGGKVSRSELIDSKLKDKQAARCLAAEAKQYRPFTPAPGRRVRLELSIKLWPGDAPLPSLPEAEELEAFERDNPGTIADEAFHAAVEPAISASRRCFAEGVARDPKLWGRLQVELQILPRGGIPKVRESESRFPDRKVVRCVRRAFRQVDFPPPEGGTTTRMLGLRLEKPPKTPDAAEPEAGGSVPDSAVPGASAPAELTAE